MTRLRSIVYLASFLLVVIALEFTLIYVFDVDASILQSLKYIVPLALAASLLLAVTPRSKGKTKKGKRKAHGTK